MLPPGTTWSPREVGGFEYKNKTSKLLLVLLPDSYYLVADVVGGEREAGERSIALAQRLSKSSSGVSGAALDGVAGRTERRTALKCWLLARVCRAPECTSSATEHALVGVVSGVALERVSPVDRAPSARMLTGRSIGAGALDLVGCQTQLWSLRFAVSAQVPRQCLKGYLKGCLKGCLKECLIVFHSV